MTDERQPGDIEIELGGRRFVMRPSYKAVCEIEEATGVGVPALAARVMNGQEKLTEIAAIVTAGLRAAGEPASFGKVGEMIFAAGLEKALGPAVEFLTRAIGGSAD